MRSWAPGLLEIDREFARLVTCRTGVGVRHRAGSRRNAQLPNPTWRTASAEEVHVACEWRVRLAGVPEVAVAAFPERTVVQVVAGEQHCADSVHQTAHGLGAQTGRVHLATDVHGHHGLGDPGLGSCAVDLDETSRGRPVLGMDRHTLTGSRRHRPAPAAFGGDFGSTARASAVLRNFRRMSTASAPIALAISSTMI